MDPSLFTFWYVDEDVPGMVEVLDGDLAGDGCSFGVLLGVTRLGTQPGGTNAVVSPKLDREELI